VELISEEEYNKQRLIAQGKTMAKKKKWADDQPYSEVVEDD